MPGRTGVVDIVRPWQNWCKHSCGWKQGKANVTPVENPNGVISQRRSSFYPRFSHILTSSLFSDLVQPITNPSSKYVFGLPDFHSNTCVSGWSTGSPTVSFHPDVLYRLQCTTMILERAGARFSSLRLPYASGVCPR